MLSEDFFFPTITTQKATSRERTTALAIITIVKRLIPEAVVIATTVKNIVVDFEKLTHIYSSENRSVLLRTQNLYQ